MERLASLDYSALFVDDDGTDTVPAMVTLTYPGDWLAVAPTNAVVQGHIKALRKRWNREWGTWMDESAPEDHRGWRQRARSNPFVGVWKREFQRRGAPHYHLLIVPPQHPKFRGWLSETWADIVGAAWCGRETAVLGLLDDGKEGIVCCERHRHIAGGTGVDFREGARATDPRRLAVYFAKHGAYGVKEYQNEGPAAWLENGGLGRFWGVWGLPSAAEAVDVDPAVAQAVARTLRRLERSKRYQVSLRVLRCTCWKRAD